MTIIISETFNHLITINGLPGFKVPIALTHITSQEA